MKPFTTLTGIVAPLDRANVDTDQIIPKQFLKSIARTGFGQNLFDEWRYLDEGQPGQDCSNRPKNSDFILNQPPYDQAQILLTRRNFGCGSSREHAPWALLEFGFRCVIAPSFADIFYNNCFKNGILPIILSEAQIESLFQQVLAHKGEKFSVDLAKQVLTFGVGEKIAFSVDGFYKERLLKGLDDIGITLEQADAIRVYEEKRKIERPWLFSRV